MYVQEFIKLLVRVRNVLCWVNNSMVKWRMFTKTVFCLYANTSFVSRSLKLLNESVNIVCLEVWGMNYLFIHCKNKKWKYFHLQ